MKHNRMLISIAATIVLVAMTAVAGVSAAQPGVVSAHDTVGAPITGAPSVCVDWNDNAFGFAQASYNGHLYLTHDGISWTDLGGPIAGPPAAVAQGINLVSSKAQVTVFVRGTDGLLYSKTTITDGASWGSWEPWPGHVAAGTGPAAYAWVDASGNLLQTGVFYVDSASHHLMWDSQTNGNIQQTDLGGIVTASPGAVAPTSSTIDVFVRGTTGALYEKMYQMGGFSGWTKFHDGVLAAGTGPTVVTGRLPTDVIPGAPDIYLFVQGTTGYAYMVYSVDNGLTWVTINQQTGAGSTHALYWLNLGGVLTSSPSGFGNIVVLARGGNGHILENDGSAPYTANTDWSGWYDVSAGP